MSQWHMNRAGFVNYWHFGETIYEFSNGKLLLRGSNGSGKSISTASFLPLLLDGNTSARRLDPLGSADRKIEDYLLGEPGVSEKEDETGYLFLEYKKSDEDRYITTGMGIRARRGGKTEKWYFIITDNRRIAIDFDLQLKRGINEHQPLSRLQLVNAIGDGGSVVRKASEYASMVNRLIFGFESMEAFQDTIQLMVDLRRPKLSKDFAPSVIYKILEDSLPPISEGTLSTISRSLQDLDEAKVRLDSARMDLERLQQVELRYNRYNDSVSSRLASKVLDIEAVAKDNEEQAIQLKRTLELAEEDLKQAQLTLKNLTQEHEVLTQEVSRLVRHEVYSLQETKDDLIQRVSGLTIRKDTTQVRFDRKETHANEQKVKLRQLENDIYHKEKEISSLLVELENLASELFFSKEHAAFTVNEVYDFLTWRTRVNALKDSLSKLSVSLHRIDEINQSIAGSDLKIADYNEDISKLEVLIKTKETEFSTMLGLIETDFSTWKNSIHFPITVEAWHETYARLNSLVDNDEYFGRINEPINEAYNRFVQDEEAKSARNEVLLGNLNQQHLAFNKELRTWENLRLPIPVRSNEAEEERLNLKNQGIEFRSFYELIEFRDTTDVETRSNIESAMMATGLLDGIVSMDQLDLQHNAQVLPQEVILNETLETYLKPSHNNTGITMDYVRVLLSSIVVSYTDREAVSISPDGSYHLGILKGASQSVKKACYIGKEAQEHYRLQMIIKLGEEIKGCLESISTHQAVEEAIRDSIDSGRKSLDTMPNDSDLIAISKDVKELLRDIKTHEINRKIYEDMKLEYVKARATHRVEVKQFEVRFDAQINLESIAMEIDGLRDYENILVSLEFIHRDMSNSIKTKDSLIEDIQLTTLDLDEMNHELNEINLDLDKFTSSIESIDVQMKLKGAEDISKKISDNRHRIDEITKELSYLQSQRLVEISSHISMTKVSESKAINDASFFSKLSTAWCDIFVRNYRIYQRNVLDEADLLNSYAKLQKANASELENRRTNDLKAYVRENQYELSNYGPELMTQESSSLKEWMHDLSSEYQVHIDMWVQEQKREVLSCLDEQNKRTNIFAVLDSLKNYVAEQEVYISEEDRKLFEDILYNSVGQDLRRLIENAEKWSHKMNAILSAQDNYRGLKLYIEWRPNRAQQEDEMHTSELVELLRKPAEMMDEADLQKMTGHFRARVDQAKILMEKDESMQTLNDVMKFVLDYRNWFSFRINYEKDLGTKRELTNNHFNKFSGGEKAIAMYLPLFTAIYARYDDAKFESPRIIALDEAFAGIDDANIAELFKAMDDLGFDYILNSQALWGDYETAKNLNIYQLIRERGSSVVVNIPFYWNGTYRQEIKYE